MEQNSAGSFSEGEYLLEDSIYRLKTCGKFVCKVFSLSAKSLSLALMVGRPLRVPGEWRSRRHRLTRIDPLQAAALSACQAEWPGLWYGQQHEQRSHERHVFQEVTHVDLLHLRVGHPAQKLCMKKVVPSMKTISRMIPTVGQTPAAHWRLRAAA
jgi:hypothetical protein